MAIAGVEPECDMRELAENPRMYAYIPHGVELYTQEQVRKILIKYTAKLAKYPLLPIMEKRQYGEVVDEFMESGE